jgi:hypothetical protein
MCADVGAKHRRNQKIERLASELVAELASSSLAKVSDTAVVGRARPSLMALRDSIAEPLPGPQKPQMTQPTVTTNHSARAVFDEGIERWWAVGRRSAKRPALAPQHPDAHNHLGIVNLEATQLEAAEHHFRAAIDGGQRKLKRDGDSGWWSSHRQRSVELIAESGCRRGDNDLESAQASSSLLSAASCA